MTLQNFYNYTQGAGAATHATVMAAIKPGAGVQPSPFGYFDLFYRMSYNAPPERAAFQECMYRILFKNTGDLFQEINAVCKYGGYITAPIYAYNPPNSGDIIQWNPAGDVKRLFMAQDQPSACRFIFFRKFGNPAEINQLAFGGFWGQEKKMIYYHGGAGTYRGGNTRQTKKKQLIKRTKKRLMNQKKQRPTKKR